ncbi:SET-binding protein [Syngnathoides biaculeatus]|uniref:SET-binding protein n=1 Tax=Syngnathoides biaculeatus TaxID=300417 RepID=UPI002ADE3736|nr:SET-binding protein [Syngnathoides biaculeatus]XP_061673867.1 SET-binding protein [Syngnathoides biaculeatus]XP_061673868.1 SET-binding protein [Syngnathoides biaculeatus]XP_061673869.1 SET-binding protein [Syngnathoides biaculeatus]XP_061673870.1 SET-binding protein [Syngnathoides biaculeatus]XP_061673871.1 SET-binding protein [Syngnathoides biaculeatus]
MEPRDPVGSARPKEAELRGGGAARNGDGPGGIGALRGDDVIHGGVSEGEGLEEQGEGLLEEQEFSIKEASFQEGSLKLKIQTTKRTKKPPKSLENYICPPEIRMTIRPPAGEGKGGRQGRAGGGATSGRGQKDEERGPPRKRTYERQFRMPEQRDGGLLQLLADPSPPKNQLRSTLLPAPAPSPVQPIQHTPAQQFQHVQQQQQQHQVSPDWITFRADSTHSEPAVDLMGSGRSANALMDSNAAFPPTVTQSHSPQRSLTPDLQLPVVTDASILNLTSLSRGKGLQEVNEQLFGNIKRKYSRKESQKVLANPHSADALWGRQSEKETGSPSNPEDRQRYRQEETTEQFREEREERRKDERQQINTGRKGEEENRGLPVPTEEGKGRKRRRKPSLEESFPAAEQSLQRQDSNAAEKYQHKPTDPKVAHKMEIHKNDSRLTSQADVGGEKSEKTERPDKSDKREKAEWIDRAEKDDSVRSGTDPESTFSVSRMKRNPVGRPKNRIDPHKHRDLALNIGKPVFSASPRLPSPNPSPSPKGSISPSLSPKARPNFSPSPRPRATLIPSPSHSTVSTVSSRSSKSKDRWLYLKAKSHTSITSPQRDICSSPSTVVDPPSAFPITPSSPLYTNTDSLTVHMPIKRKRGRPKKQPLLTVETIHEGTSTSPPSPLLAQETSAGLNRRRKSNPLTTAMNTKLVQMVPTNTSSNSSGPKVKRGRSNSKPVNKVKLGKMQSILNEILSSSSKNSTIKSPSAPVASAMNAVASTIEARLGKQINVSKRGTIYIGKKRGRKPRAEMQGANLPKSVRDKPCMTISTTGLYESSVMSAATSSPNSSAPPMRASHPDASMPSLQPISALPPKPVARGFLSGGWKLSPPRLLANSPSQLSEGASVKEVTLSPISESHSEETIPSDSGIGTDNNSTSDQTEKGPASRRRYSFDLCGFEAAEAAALEASARGNRARSERQASVDNFLSQQEKKQKHNRRKRKCLQSRDHIHFLSELEEVVAKLQQLRVSHRRYTCYPQNPYPSIFRLNFHHYYPVAYDTYPCDSGPYVRRSAELKAKRRRGRPAKASEPIASKIPFVQGYGYPLAGGNYYAAPYAMPYTPHLSLGYFPPAPPFYLPHHSLGHVPPSPFMRPAVPPPKAFHTSGHSKLQPGVTHHRSGGGQLQGPSARGEGLGSVGSGSAGGLGGLRLHKRKHKHKHKHKDEPLLSPRDRQELGGLFSGAKANSHRNMLSDMRGQGPSTHQEKRPNGRGSGLGSTLGMFEPEKLSSHSLSDGRFHLRPTGQPMNNSFTSSYRNQSRQQESASFLFLGSQENECGSRSRKMRPTVFGDQGLMSLQSARQGPVQMNERASPPLSGAPGKRRYKRREVEQIQKEVRRMHSLNFEHVQKILRAKRLQRQAKTGNNMIKRRPGRPRKQPPDDESGPVGRREENRADGRTQRMPVLERCDEPPARQTLRPTPTPEPLEFSDHDSISATIEKVVHKARSVPAPAKGGKRRGRAKDNLWSPSNQ